MTTVRTLMLAGIEVPYTLRRRKGQGTIALKVTQNGSVTVTTGLSAPLFLIERFLERKSAWLTKVFGALPTQAPLDPRVARADYEQHKEAARTLVHRDLARLNAHYGFPYGRVSIRDTVSRWGSCSSKKNLNFSYRVLFLPSHLREYVLVHELCHLREMNHAPAFWRLVAETVPDYKERRKEVRGMRLS